MSSVVRSDAMNRRIKGYFTNATSKDEVLYGFVEGYSLATDANRWSKGMDPRVPTAQFRNAVNIGAIIAQHSSKSMFGYTTKVALVNNPLFSLNGHEDNPSNATEKYLMGHISEGKRATAFSYTAPGKLKIGYHAQSVASTTAHLNVMKSMAGKSRKTGKVADWLSVVIQMKNHKRKVRGAKLGGAVTGCFVPYGGFLAIPVVEYLKSGKATLKFSCVASAIELHWRAFQETTISTGGEGPASRILWELFKNRGAYKVVSKDNIAEFIKEPAGWLPIKERLMAL